ncbi:acetoin utilization protein AcuC [Paenibacillus yanchengensis]|uniref:Acetoin utilization protein AcuC n=1 Tax=Paenibacillus yanchengensis TaxID=2035833 RepID=A0ABW4YKA4_9BACL
MSANALFFHHPAAKTYKFNDEHPFHPLRADLTIQLLQAQLALTKQQIVQPTLITDDHILTSIHRTEYIQAVQAASDAGQQIVTPTFIEKYGIGTEDTPPFPGLHQAALAIVSGSVAAADAVMNGTTQHAYHISGGLHHAFPERAGGFCIYNDAAIAIAHLKENYGARVLYIDTDVHHGDGVQWAFYDNPDVCTYSIHETGKFLFPGTGFVYEKGLEQGYGTCFNVPLEPYTEDESWLESFQTTIEAVISFFQPDIIVSQHGCDAHAFDPLSHLHCSMNIYHAIPAIIHRLAHQYTNGRWVALGGGGYDIWRVVPRAWSLVWLEMNDQPIFSGSEASKQQVKQDLLSIDAVMEQIYQMKDVDFSMQPKLLLPEQWRKLWQPASPVPLPQYWLDLPQHIGDIPRRQEITKQNRATQTIAIQDIK